MTVHTGKKEGRKMAYKNPSDRIRSKKVSESKDELNEKMKQEAEERKRTAEAMAAKRKAAGETKKSTSKSTAKEEETVLKGSEYEKKLKDAEWEEYRSKRMQTSVGDDVPGSVYETRMKERQSAASKENEESRRIAKRSPSYVDYIGRKVTEWDAQGKAQEEAERQYKTLIAGYLDRAGKNTDIYNSQKVSNERAEETKEDVWKASEEATALRNYLKANRGLLGDEQVAAYEEGINNLMKGYTETAKEENSRETAKKSDYLTERENRQTVEESIEDENALENQKAQAVADYINGVKAGRYGYSEEELATIRESYDNKIAAAKKQRMKASDVAGGYDEQYKAARDKEIEAAEDVGIDLTKASWGEKAFSDIVYGAATLEDAILGAPARLLTGVDDLLGIDPKSDLLTRGAQWVQDQTAKLKDDAEARMLWNNRNRNNGEDWVTTIDPNTGKEVTIQNQGSMFGTNVMTNLVGMLPDLLMAYASGGTSAMGSLAKNAGGMLSSIASTPGVWGKVKGFVSSVGKTFKALFKNPIFYESAIREFSGYYDDALEKGATPAAAVTGATIVGIINGAVEIGLDPAAMSGVQGLEQAVRGGEDAILKWVESSLEEGGEEYVQNMVAHLIEAATPGVNEDFAMGWEDTKELATEMGMGALIGGIAGGANIVADSVINSTEEARAMNTADNEAVRSLVASGLKKEAGSDARSRAEALNAKLEAGKRITVDEVLEAQKSLRNEEKLDYMRELIGQGMESAEGTESRKAAEALNAKLEAGEEITDEEIIALVDANDQAIAEEESISDESGTRGRLEEETELRTSEDSVRESEDILPEKENTPEEDAEKAQAVLDTAAERIGGNAEGAEMIKGLYRPGKLGMESYAAKMELAYEYGVQNYPVQEITKKESLAGLTETQITAAYGLGQIELQDRTERSDARKENAEAVKSGVRKAVLAEGVTLTTVEQKKARLALDLAARTTNTRIVLENADTTDSGWYDERDGSIHINMRAAENGGSAVLQVAAHELTHMIRNRSESEFRDLQSFLFAEYASVGQNIETLVEDEMRAAEAAGRTLTEEEALEEVVADSMETMLNDGVVLKRLAEQNPTLVEKILAKIEEIIASIKELMTGEHAGTLAGTAAENLENAETVRDRLGEALAAVANKESKAKNGKKHMAGRSEVDSEGNSLSEQQAEYFKDSKIRDENGNLRVVYHGTNTGDFTVFDPKYIGMSSGDDGFFGKGFYFAYSRGEAAYYGAKRIIEAYLDIKNPFDFEKNFQMYDGNKTGQGYAHDAIQFMNFSKLFTEIAKNITIDVVEKGSNEYKTIGIIDFSKELEATIKDTHFEVQKVKSNYGEEWVAMADKFAKEYVDRNGVKREFTDYRYKQNFYSEKDARDQLFNAYNYLEKVKYSSIDMYSFTRLILDNNDEFTEALKEKGYDGTIQSEYGDEAVAFYPEQIKNIDNKAPTENTDIRYMASRRKNGMSNIQLLRRAGSGLDLSPEEIKAVSDFRTDAGRVDIQAEKLYGIQETIRSLEEVDREGNAEAIKSLAEQEYLEQATLDRMQADLRKKANGKALAGIVKRMRAEAQENAIAEAEEIRAGEITPVEEKKVSMLEAQAKEIKALKAANKRLSEKLEKTKAELTKGDGERHIRKDDIRRMAKNLLEEVGNKQMEVGEVEKALTAMSDILLNEPNSEGSDIESMTRTLARELMEGAEETRDDLEAERKKLTGILRETRVKLPENLKGDIDKSYVRTNFWWLGSKKGAEVDEVWRELQDRFGENLFPEDIINPADQIYAIGDAIAALQPVTYNPYKGMEAASEIAIANSIMDGLISPELRQEKASVADQLEGLKREVKDINKSAKAIDRQRESLERRLTQRNRYDMQKAVRAELASLSKMLTSPSPDLHVQEGMRKTAAELSALVDLDSDALRMQRQRVAELTRNYNGAKTEEGKAWNLEKLKAAERRLDYLERKQKAIADKLADDLGTGMTGDELIRMEGKGLADKLRRIAEEYKNSAENDGSYDEGVHEAIMNACKQVGNVPFRRLSFEALQALDDAARTIQAGISNANRLFKAGRDETVEKNASNTIMQMREQAEIMKPKLSTTGAGGFLMWDNLKPWAAFDYIGSKTMTRLFNNLQEGEQIAARDYDEARAYAQACKKKYGYDGWDMQEPVKIKCKFDKEVSLTLGERMALYAYSKREQAAPHLMQGGFMLQSGFERIKDANGKKTYKVRNEAVYSLNQEQIVAVVNSLTKEQQDYVDAMQDYLSSVMGAKGNEVTMTMYGTRNFRERNYFPLMVSDAFIDSRMAVTEGSRMMKNAGFTKSLVINANKTVVLQDFNEVFAEHCAQMAAFHGLVLPIEDFTKVYNKQYRGGDEMQADSVKQVLQETFGGNARKYIEQFMRDLNGKQSVRSIQGVDALVKVFKVSKTAANLSVIVQQHTSVYRAMAYIEPKYFRSAPIKAAESYAECMQYAPVAVIKKMGYFDTGSGRTAAGYIMEDDYEGIAAKTKGFFTDAEYRADIFGYGAEKADEKTWAQMWEACKRKAKAEAKQDTDEEAVKQAAGKIFNEAMLKTQVYDSVFTRSENMRKTDTFSKIATSFMAEQTTTYNLMLSAVWDAKRGNKSLAGKKIAGAVTATFFANAWSGAIGAMRDDDEKKTYPEKLTQAVIENMITSAVPLNYIPILRDVLSILQGYDVAHTDVEVIADIKDATEKMIKEAAAGKVTFNGVVDELAAVLAPLEIPLANIKRDAGGIYNTIMRTVESGFTWNTTAEGMERAMKEGALGRYYKAESNAEMLYSAYVSGKTPEINRALANFKNADAAQTALKQQLREKDQRMKDAAEAMTKGDTRTYQQKINAVIQDGVFGKKLVVDAVNAQVSAINTAVSDYTEAFLESNEETMTKKEATLRKMVSGSYADELIEEAKKTFPTETEEENTESYVSIFKPENVADAIEAGDAEQAATILEDLLEVAGGDAEAEKKIKTKVKAAITKKYKSAYAEGTAEERRAIRSGMEKTGLYGDTLDDVLEGWEK